MDDPKVLLWDTEFTPNQGYFWGLWDQRIPITMVNDTQRMLCFGAKWLGKPTKVFDERIGRKEMLETLRDYLTEADMVVSWNGQKYDTRMANREFLKAGLTPPAPYKEVDLMRVVKSKMAFASNKLDFVAQELGVGSKVDTGGFDLWRGVMSGDEASWRKMRRYQKQDVDLLEKLFTELRPWIKIPHPITEDPTACHLCKSTRIQRRGWERTLYSKYPRYQCQDCGKWLRGMTRHTSSEFRAI